MVLFTTIGYSAMNATVNFKGDVAFRVAGDIRIIGVNKSANTNNALSTYAEFSKNTLALGTSMPANSSITYSFKIKNSSAKVGLLKSLSTTGAKATATQSMSLEVAYSSSTSLSSASKIPASSETTYTLTLTNNTTSAITDQRLLTFTFDYVAEGLEEGSNFNVHIKTLAGDSNPTYSTKNTSITAIKMANTLPSSVETIDVSAGKDGSIKAYFDNGTIYLYTQLSKILLNSNSYYLFNNLTKVTKIDTSKFDTSNVTNMSSMLYYCGSLTSLDVSNFDTKNVTNMSFMFSWCSSLMSLDVSGFDTSIVTNMSSMFYYCSSLTSLDVSGFDTSKVTNMSLMFFSCSSLTSLDVSQFDTSIVTNMSNMFGYCSKIKTIYASSKFNTSNVTNSKSMFSVCRSLIGGNGTTYNSSYIDKTYARIDSSTPGYFTSKS